MSLPIVLEIAIGLIFIYLTLSLVASEIQEILSALFQWRAEHLKRSIEQLLAGDISTASRLRGRSSKTHDAKSERSETPAQTNPAQTNPARSNQAAAKMLTDRLYESPLIENLNYEATGGISGFFRSILHGVGRLYRVLTFSRSVFGRKTSGPSYIPAETFATSLIERLQLKDFQRLLIRSRFDTFLADEVRLPLHNTVNELRARLENEELMAAETIYFDQSLDQISADLNAQRLSLSSALMQVTEQLQAFENMATDTSLIETDVDPAVMKSLLQSFLGRIRYLRTSLSGHSSKNQALTARLQPGLADLTALLDADSATYKELVALAQREGQAVNQLLEKLQEEVVPPKLRESLKVLASRAEAKVDTAGTEIQQLQAEVESWFNNGMERASGVYRRNVKGVGILVGLAIAFALNADTFYMFQRLSTDSAVRSSVLQTAEQLELQNLSSAADVAEALSIDQLSDRIENDLRSVGSAVEDALADYPLPIGRSQTVIAAQQAAEANWPIPFIPQRLIGWLMTALALSMGASFWFDLLRKVTSVRSSGNKPNS